MTLPILCRDLGSLEGGLIDLSQFSLDSSDIMAYCIPMDSNNNTLAQALILIGRHYHSPSEKIPINLEITLRRPWW